MGCTLVKQQVADIFPWRSGLAARLVERLQPELDLILQTVLWRQTIWADAPTPGGRLQNLRYAQASSTGVAPLGLGRGQKLGFLFVYAVCPWFATRLEEAAQRVAQVDDEPARAGSGAFW